MLLRLQDPFVPTNQCTAGKSADVLSVDVAAEKAIRAATPLSRSEKLGLLDTSGRVLDATIVSPINIPPFCNSAMDGYAVNTGGLAGSGPWTLGISDRIVAGDVSSRPLVPGTAARIMTGAPIPSGADAVIMQEACEKHGDTIIVRQRPQPGKNIRNKGEDVALGTEIVASGTLLDARQIALLAAAGVNQVSVKAKLTVGLISTGSELADPGQPLLPGQIYNSNRYFLRASLDKPWITTIDYGIDRDDAQLIRSTVRQVARDCDVLITTGGVSAGEEDHMLDVLRHEAAELSVMKVAMRPGKPVTVGKLGSTLYVGLPGNLFATAVTFAKIAWPAIRAAAGMTAEADRSIEAIAGFEIDHKIGRTEFIPVTWSRRDACGRPIAEILGRGSSASLSPFAQARAIAVLPPDTSTINVGDRLRLEPMDL